MSAGLSGFFKNVTNSPGRLVRDGGAGLASVISNADEAVSNFQDSGKRSLEFWDPEDGSVDLNRTVAIIGGGPTIWADPKRNPDGDEGAGRLAALDQQDKVLKIVTGTAHRLLDEGQLSRADVSVYNNPSKEFASSIGDQDHGLEYWLASGCDPAVFDAVDGRDVRVFDAFFDGIDYAGRPGPIVDAGTTAPVGAVLLCLMQGYRDFEFYGVDGGNFGMTPYEYAYDYDDIREQIDPAEFEDVLLVGVGGQVFKVGRPLWEQFEEMKFIIDSCGDEVSFKFHGTSMNNRVFDQGGKIDFVHDPVTEQAFESRFDL